MLWFLSVRPALAGCDAADLQLTFLPDGEVGRAWLMVWYWPLMQIVHLSGILLSGLADDDMKPARTKVPFTWLSFLRHWNVYIRTALRIEAKQACHHVFGKILASAVLTSNTEDHVLVTIEIPSSRKRLCLQCLPVEKDRRAREERRERSHALTGRPRWPWNTYSLALHTVEWSETVSVG